MNPEETKKTIEAEIESDSADPIESLVTLIAKSWVSIAVGLLIAVVIVAAYYFYQKRARLARETAFTQLAVASTPQQFSEIIRQYPSSKAAEMATLMAARTKYDSGNYDEADQFYADFITQHPGHFMVPAAKLGRLHCQEASGQLEEALDGFRKFVADNPGESALCVVAQLGEARCLRAKGQLQDAIGIYDRLITEQPAGDWRPLLEDLKTSVKKDLERLSGPAAVPAVMANPAAPTPAAVPAASNAPAAP